MSIDIHDKKTAKNQIYTDDPRNTDARTPTVHKASHATGGSDALAASDIGALPASGGTLSGNLVFADYLAQRPTIKDYAETVKAHGTDGGAITCDLEDGNVHTITLDEATTFTFSNPPASGKAGSLTLIINQGTTAYAVTWPSSVDWSGGSAPDLSTVSTDYVLVFLTTDGGTTWRGWLSGSAFA